jgi:hypothetical protein
MREPAEHNSLSRRSSAWWRFDFLALRGSAALLLLMAAGVARAEDWVAALDVPALSELETPELRVVYPVRGLPAVVAAGDVLVARVLLPAALTPPPGVQQERALTGFAAELIGSGFVLQGGAQHRHRVIVSEVRPDGPASDATLGQGEGVRLALAAAPALALRVGRELWLHSQASARDPGFARDANDAADIEHRARVQLNDRLLARRLAPLTAAAGVTLKRLDHALAVECAAAVGGECAELSLLLPAHARLHIDRGSLALYPAGDLQMREVRSVIGRWTVPAGAARLTLEAAPARDPDYQLGVTRARSGKHVILRVQGAPAGARVAFDYGHGRTAFAGPELRASFAGPLEQPVRALVLPRDGGARLLRARVLVEPSRPPSCDVGRRQRQEPARGTAVAAMVLFALGFLLKRRSARGPGNRLGRDDRL